MTVSTKPTPVNEAARLADGICGEPVGFVADFFGDRCIGRQAEVLEALRDYDEVFVRSCHDSGKTFVAARAALWFLMAHPGDAIVLTTAPSWGQVEGLLWREIAQAYGRAKVGIGGRLLTTKLDLAPRWYAIGLATDPGTAVNLQGYHASNVLVILDEADGIAPQIWTALDGVLTSAGAKILAIGNPLDPTSEFRKRHDLAMHKPSAKCIKISADDVLPLTDSGEHPYLLQRSWVEDKAVRWGKNSALYMGKVEAEWPDQGTDTLIPISWLHRAKDRAVPRRERTLGVDVARFGTNRTVRTLMAGGWLEWSKATAKEDTMQTAGRVHQDIEEYGPIATAVDDSGVGGGVTDRLRQLGRRVRAINNGEKPDDAKRFVNKGSEMYWAVRTALERDEIGFSMEDPDAIEELINDLNRPKYETDSQARIKVDKHGLKRGTTTNSLSDEALAASSPDRGDSFVLAFAAAKPFLKPRVLRPGNLIPERYDSERYSRYGYDETGAMYDKEARSRHLEETGSRPMTPRNLTGRRDHDD